MKGQNNNIADSKGFLVNLLSIVAKVILLLPALLLNIGESKRKKQVGGYFYTLGYGRDIWGNKLIAPYANRYFIPADGHLFGLDEPISLPLAVNCRDDKFLDDEAKWWVYAIEKANHGHMRTTLKGHDYELGDIDKKVETIMKSKPKFPWKQMLSRIFNYWQEPLVTIFVLAVGIPLNYYTFPSPYAIVYDIVMSVLLFFVWKFRIQSK